MESGLGNGSSKNLSRTDSENNTEGVTPDGTENYGSPHSAASSLPESESIADGLFQLDQVILPNSNDSDPKSPSKSNENEKVHRRETKSDISIVAHFSLERIHGSSGSISQDSDVTHESLVPTISPTQSPPVQVMERSAGYDANRIPASVFTSTFSAPVEWSANSDDSLFSIQIGNSSARDPFTITGADSPNLEEVKIPEESYKWKELKKSGELSTSKEFRSSGVVKNSDHDQVIALGQTSPVTKEEEERPKDLDLGKDSVALTDKLKNIPYGRINIGDKANQEAYKNKNVIQHSDQNGINIQSSAFPIQRKFSMSLCLCSKRPCWSFKWLCSASSCCKWPSWSTFSFKCHCSNYSWMFCCTWKNTKKIFCCSCFKSLKDRRMRKLCSCSCCCASCSSCSYSCC